MRTKRSKRTRQYPAETASLILITGGLSIAIALVWLYVMGRLYRANKTKLSLTAPALVCGCPPGPALTGRIHAAHRLIMSGQATECIISGRGEAEYGQALLVSLGVERARITMETEATNTVENLLNVAATLKTTQSWVVSDDWHMPRILWIAKQLDYQLVPWPSRRSVRTHQRLRYYVREAAAINQHFMRTWLPY